MNELIFSRDNSIEPNGAIGLQKCGIIFWQKTGFLRHCNELGFQSIITLSKKKFSPTSVSVNGNVCLFEFDDDERKTIYISLKKEKESNHFYIYGESHTVYAGVDFHIFSLDFVDYIAQQIGCKFYVDDATQYLEHRSVEKLRQYINGFDLKPAVSDDLLHAAAKKQYNCTDFLEGKISPE